MLSIVRGNMGVRQITKILGDIPIRRVEGGDAWVDRANAELRENIYSRSMSGDEIIAKYETLNLEQKELSDIAFDANDAEINELVDEVYRIREDVVETKKDSHKDSYLQVFGLLLSMFLTAIGVIVVVLVIMASATDKQIPDGFIYQLGKFIFEYLLEDKVYLPDQ